MGSDDRDERERQGVDALRADREGQEGRREPPEPEEQRGKIPQTRIGRSAKLGTAIGSQATRYAGTAAANVVRSDEKAQERLETRHLESALKMASVLGEMKGAAMKIGQMASFIDVDFLPPEHREIYQEQLAKLRTSAPAMPWEQVHEILEDEYEKPPNRVFAEIEPEAFAAASIGQVHRATLQDGTRVAVKVQYPGIADALESDLANAGHDRAAREGARARPRRQGRRLGAARAGSGGARLRVRGAEPARLRPRLRRAPLHLRPAGPLAVLSPPRSGL